jgi:hypothetical protein
MTYITKLGDTFDSIAFSLLGDRKYTKELMEANAKHLETVIFSAGITLNIPELSEDLQTETSELPPWRAVE